MYTHYSHKIYRKFIKLYLTVSHDAFKNYKSGYQMDPQSSKCVVSFVPADHLCTDIDTDIVILHIYIKIACFHNILQP